MRVLIAESNSDSAQMMEIMLVSEGFTVYTTSLGGEAIELAKMYEYGIILLELNLPDMHGLDVLRAIRRARIPKPIMIVTGTTSIDIKLKTFSGGADDFVSKPFHKDELVCRIHAIIRRSKGHPEPVIRTGNILVNMGLKAVEVSGERVHLTPKEYQVIELLSLRKGTMVTKEMFLDHLYDGIDDPESNVINVYVSKVRKKIGKSNKGIHHIETIQARGFALCDPIPQSDVVPFSPAHSPQKEVEARFA